MRRLLLLLTIVVAAAVKTWAVPANTEPYVATNPDGTTVTVVLHGDEFYSYHTTVDGYTVMRNHDGAWVYAKLEGSRIAPTTVVAHDASARTGAELSLLASTPKQLIDTKRVEQAKLAVSLRNKAMTTGRSTKAFRFPNGFRGLIVLVNYADQKFHRTDAQEFYSHMANDVGYTGYTSTVPIFNKYGKYTGSVRDYFSDNSMGMFQPEFDVIGPIDMDEYNMTDGRDNSGRMFLDIINSMWDDFGINLWEDYDNDGDGCVDLVFFIVAGFGSNYTGNDENYLWPHASYFVSGSDHTTPVLRFACSVEYYGQNETNKYIPDGIGTICHEFSHCLGVKDLYDTDYSTNGQSNHPGRWDIMASGPYLNFGRTPAGYSLYDRYANGFVTPPTITQPGHYSLNALGDSNEGFIIQSPNSEEKFLLENRQLTSKWDQYIPGHGLIVARMDSVNAEVWRTNKVNCDASHNYYELVRACGVDADSDHDPYPGAGNVTSIAADNSSSPNLLTWDGQACDFGLENITESGGVISFDIQGSTELTPLTVCNIPIDTNTDWDALVESWRSEGIVSGNGSMYYDPYKKTLYIENLTINPGDGVSRVIWYNNIGTTLDTLHIDIQGNVTIKNYHSGNLGTVMYLEKVHTKIEGDGMLTMYVESPFGRTVFMRDNSAFELNGCVNIEAESVNGFAFHANDGGRIIVHDYDYARPAYIKMRGGRNTTSLITEIDLSDGYWFSSHPGATLDANSGKLKDASGNEIVNQWVTIEQSRLPLYVGMTLQANWSQSEWVNINNAMKQIGVLNSDGFFSYDHATRTLTLNNARFNVPTSANAELPAIGNGYYSPSISSYIPGIDGLTINVIGDCRVTQPKGPAMTIYAAKTLLTGNGTLTLNQTGSREAIHATGGNVELTLDGPNLTASAANEAALYALRGKLNVNAGKLTMTASNSLPLLGWTTVNLAEGYGVLQPEGGKLVQGNTFQGWLVATSSGSTFRNGTAIIGLLGGLLGDVNGDGMLNVGDVSELYRIILGIDLTNANRADVNGDGLINSGDVSAVYAILLAQ